jgi:hypothetical protein
MFDQLNQQLAATTNALDYHALRLLVFLQDYPGICRVRTALNT